MNRNNIYFILYFFLLLLLSNSCKKEDTLAPEITLHNPADNDNIENGMLQLNASITDNEGLAETTIQLVNTSDGAVVFEKSEEVQGKETNLEESISFLAPEGGNFELTIQARDNADNTATERISLTADPTNRGTLNLNFRLQYDGQTMLMYENYSYPEPLFPFSISLLSFYISNITIVDGNEEKEILEIERIRFNENQDNLASAEAGVTLSIPLIEPGNYSTIRFGIGVPPDLNAKSPVDFPQNHPLFFSGEYWDSWNSYIFFKIEGKADTDNNSTQETNLALHAGSDDAFREKEFITNLTITAQQSTTLNFVIEVKDIFDNDGSVYDLISTPQIHSINQSNQVSQLADNLKKAFQ